MFEWFLCNAQPTTTSKDKFYYLKLINERNLIWNVSSLILLIHIQPSLALSFFLVHQQFTTHFFFLFPPFHPLWLLSQEASPVTSRDVEYFLLSRVGTWLRSKLLKSQCSNNRVVQTLFSHQSMGIFVIIFITSFLIPCWSSAGV